MTGDSFRESGRGASLVSWYFSGAGMAGGRKPCPCLGREQTRQSGHRAGLPRGAVGHQGSWNAAVQAEPWKGPGFSSEEGVTTGSF